MPSSSTWECVTTVLAVKVYLGSHYDGERCGECTHKKEEHHHGLKYRANIAMVTHIIWGPGKSGLNVGIPQTTSSIRWCMQVYMYVWRVNLDRSCLGQTVCARQFLRPKPTTKFCHRWAERNHSDHYTDSEVASWLPNSLIV